MHICSQYIYLENFILLNIFDSYCYVCACMRACEREREREREIFLNSRLHSVE